MCVCVHIIQVLLSHWYNSRLVWLLRFLCDMCDEVLWTHRWCRCDQLTECKEAIAKQSPINNDDGGGHGDGRTWTSDWHKLSMTQVLRLSWCRGIMGWAGGEPWLMMKLELLAIGRVSNLKSNEKNVVPALSSAYLILSFGSLPRKLQELTQ